jgi:hypothetical protein
MRNHSLARVYSFDIQFTGSKRTSFYRELLGFSSRTTKTDKDGRTKTYIRDYSGLLTSIPHLHLGKSVIAAPAAAAPKLDAFFEDSRWHPVKLYTFDAVLPARDRLRAMWEAFGRVRVQPDFTLDDELDSLHSLPSHSPSDSETLHRVRRALRVAEELMEVDWSDGQAFSRELENKLAPLRKRL